MVSKSEFKSRDRFPGGESINFLFNSDIANLLLKTNEGRDRRSYFVIFVVWSALIVGGCVVVAWGRKSCLWLAAISSFVLLVLFKDGGRRVSPKESSFCF